MTIIVPIASVTPVPTAVPTTFETLEAKTALIVQEIETHLQSFNLATLQKFDALVKAGQALPWGLETYRAQIISFLDAAIGWAQDAVTAAQLLVQLGLISAAPVTAS